MEKYISFSTMFTIIEFNVQGDLKTNVLIETNVRQTEDITAIWPCDHVFREKCVIFNFERGSNQKFWGNVNFNSFMREVPIISKPVL